MARISTLKSEVMGFYPKKQIALFGLGVSCCLKFEYPRFNNVCKIEHEMDR